MRVSIPKHAFRLVVGFLALAVAGPIRAFQDGITHSPTPSSLDATRYTMVMAGEGFLDGLAGVGTALYAYRAPDGEIIGTEKAAIGSADGVFAKTFHQKIDDSADKIVKQEDIMDASGKVIGYRSVLTLVDKDGKKSTAIVITKGADFLRLACAAAADVLAFEDEYNKEMAAKQTKSK
jgi:hypothetical protein